MLLALVVVGCGSSQEADLRQGSSPDPATWPGLQAITDQALLQPIVMGAGMGDFAGVKQAASDPKFQEAATKFETDPIPGKFKTPEREAAKTEAVKHVKALIEGAKGTASDEELKASVDGLNKAINTLAAPTPAKT
jgi:hypothetical protein